MQIILPGLLAGLLNTLLIPFILLVARKNQWFDKPDPRKIHTDKIPRLGGVGIFLAFIGSIAVSLIFSGSYRQEILLFWPVLVSMLAVHLLGLVDDFYDLNARFKFIVQVGAAVFVVAMGYRFTHIWLPGLGSLAIGWLSWPLTLFWIVGVLNAINMIDGLDGLSSGISLIAALGIGLLLMEHGAGFPALMALCLVGSLAGYLLYNFPPAKIFMGDSGSTFLGFTLAVLPLLDTGHVAEGLWFWGAITLLLVPVFDVFAAILRRKRGGVPMMSPDKWHIHHKLMHFGFSTRTILGIIYALCMLATLVAISVLALPALWYWLLTVVVWLGFGAFFIVLHYAKERSLRKAHTVKK